RDENGKRHKKTGCTDKTESLRIGNQLENQKALRRAGLIDPKAEAYRDHEACPIAEHLRDYHAYLATKGATPKHADLAVYRARRVMELAKVDRLPNLTAERIQQALKALLDEGLSLQTANHHRTAIRAFSRWLWKNSRIRLDSLAGVTGFNVKEDRRHDRRTIGVAELRRLIKVAESGPPWRKMTGPMRALCYRLAVTTGLRYSEIASITPESFDWTADPATVTVSAAYTKNGEPAILPLPHDLAGDLAPYVATVGPGELIFPLAPDCGAKMLRPDLERAGIPYRDAGGLVFDFHALRCQCATLADTAGVTPRVVQKLMRHSTLELTGRYTRPRAVDIAAAACMLPSLKPETDRPEAVAMTGTDANPILGSIATEIATDPEDDDPNPFGGKPVVSSRKRSHNPQVWGSSPHPGISRTSTNLPVKSRRHKALTANPSRPAIPSQSNRSRPFPDPARYPPMSG
ncbi:MAG TPA: site-specific integrase, partial [Isosphaeraceae bacterium]|nr:site-specific integrase [Isosphaeraceae bacterium]